MSATPDVDDDNDDHDTVSSARYIKVFAFRLILFFVETPEDEGGSQPKQCRAGCTTRDA